MTPNDPLLPRQQPIPLVRSGHQRRSLEGQTLATRDHDVIREWADRRHATPATGEGTSSGPPTVDVHDGGAGIRFNFPSVSPFRDISWDEWLNHFDSHGLTFVFEESAAGETASHRYRLVRTRDWASQFEPG